eukprot:TRINITY_DN3424_c0_g1_i2.p1 TRINITY_DN3424_c0_g1~~TRINITY_DN3424_c0_g1_i2.p1  ORF type:complete len:512 (+),score=114.07 TRINITY_DN3424_c0_g1_i2:65-1600(+)
MRFLDFVQPVARFIPQVKKSTRNVALKEKLGWTAVVLLVYLVCCQIPLFGIQSSMGQDPFQWLRMIMASNRGTLMELGISPLVTSSLILQFIQNAKIIDCDMNNAQDRALFEALQKIFGIIFTMGQAFMFIMSGMYGPIGELGTMNIIVVLVQLVIAGVIVLLMDELLQNYGLGSGISLFIATNVCESIVWKSFSPSQLNVGRGMEYEGAVVALFHFLITRSDRARALHYAFQRSYLPNMSNLLATVGIFVLVVYLQGFRVNIGVKNARQRGATGQYPIKLFYTSNMPIILQSALVTNMYMISQMLYKKFSGNMLVNILGQWVESQGSRGQAVPVAGLAYYMSPPHSVTEMISDPIHAVFYIIFVLGKFFIMSMHVWVCVTVFCFFIFEGRNLWMFSNFFVLCAATCGLFSKLWIDVAGQSPRDVARQFREQDMVVMGHRQSSSIKVLQRYIPIAAAFGGVCIGALSVTADLLGAIGSGTGILLAVTTIYGYYETIAKDTAAGSGLGFFGM